MSGSYTHDNDLELIASGQDDWDTSINANFAMLERGHHAKLLAGSAVSSGQVVTVSGSGTVVPTDAMSAHVRAHFISPFSVSSGSNGYFLATGNIRSMAIWSAHITPGQPVFVAANSPGFVVRSFAGHGDPIGLAISHNAIRFSPGQPRVFPDRVTDVATVGPITVGSFGDFALLVGNRGIVRDVTVVSSHNRMKLYFWSGSSRVSSELLYETLTRSIDPGSVDINSTYFRDAALFPQRNTDASTTFYMYGRIDAQSGTGVTSAYAVVTVIAERFA
jgi:hypothetical protein